MLPNKTEKNNNWFQQDFIAVGSLQTSTNAARMNANLMDQNHNMYQSITKKESSNQVLLTAKPSNNNPKVERIMFGLKKKECMLLNTSSLQKP